jgi:deoxyribodipyrimidine photo-lyase
MASRTAAATKGPKKGTTYAPRIAPGLPLAAAARSATAPSAETKTSTSRKPRLVFHWFRNDLRLHDNPALAHSVASSEVCVPVYVFDPKWFGDRARTRWGTPKWGPRRAKFLLESVRDLRRRLEGLSPSSSSPSSSKGGVGLVVAHGNVGDVFERLVASVKGSYDVSVVTQEEPLQEEADAVRQVRDVLQRLLPRQRNSEKGSEAAASVRTVWGSTLYELADLPFDPDLGDLPDVFTPFRTKVEKACKIPKPLPVPRFANNKSSGANLEEALSSAFVESDSDADLDEGAPGTAIRGLSLSFLPTLESLGYTDEQIREAQRADARGAMSFEGGETRALGRVRNYIWDDPELLRTYFDTRNGMIGPNSSTKLSPWLALGCLSPRHVAAEVARYEERVVKNKSTYWLVFELLWRDYCKFFCVKHGNRVFCRDGTVGAGKNPKEWSTNAKNWEAWKSGLTGYPLVDANMRELQATGWMSNRGRQNVCSFLAIDLGHDWRQGTLLLAASRQFLNAASRSLSTLSPSALRC